MAGSADSQDGHIGFQIAPMVDVVFVLMLFFMASAGMQVVEKELSVTPSGKHGSVGPTQLIPVKISSEGVVSVNDQVYGSAADKELPQLRVFLKNALAQFGNEDVLGIQPAPDVRQQRIMEVLSAIANATVMDGGRPMTFEKVTFL